LILKEILYICGNQLHKLGLTIGAKGLLFAILVENICCVAIFAIISLVNLLNVNWFN
jgi:hypothetical protein